MITVLAWVLGAPIATSVLYVIVLVIGGAYYDRKNRHPARGGIR